MREKEGRECLEAHWYAMKHGKINRPTQRKLEGFELKEKEKRKRKNVGGVGGGGGGKSLPA